MNSLIKVRIAVGAYIIRQTPQAGYQLLLFTHADEPDVPFQVPGGGVDAGEAIEQALYREIWEESGLTNLRLIRKLGVTETCWIQPRKLISQRHYFLLETSSETPDEWQHTVQGGGCDTGMVFSYFWHDMSQGMVPLPEFGSYFLHPERIPELYQRTPASTAG